MHRLEILLWDASNSLVIAEWHRSSSRFTESKRDAARLLRSAMEARVLGGVEGREPGVRVLVDVTFLLEEAEARKVRSKEEGA